MPTINGQRFSFTQPICAECFGRPATTIVQEFRTKEICCQCGKENTDGIYIRVDPTTVRYPTPESEDKS